MIEAEFIPNSSAKLAMRKAPDKKSDKVNFEQSLTGALRDIDNLKTETSPKDEVNTTKDKLKMNELQSYLFRNLSNMQTSSIELEETVDQIIGEVKEQSDLNESVPLGWNILNDSLNFISEHQKAVIPTGEQLDNKDSLLKSMKMELLEKIESLLNSQGEGNKLALNSEEGISINRVNHIKNADVLLASTIREEMETLIKLFAKEESKGQSANSYKELRNLVQQLSSFIDKNSQSEKVLNDLVSEKATPNKEHSWFQSHLNKLVRPTEVNFSKGSSIQTSSQVAELNQDSSVHVKLDSNITTLTDLQLSAPMSKIEQFVVHVSQFGMGDAPSAKSELMDEIQKVLKSSKFINTTGGSNQLVLKLRPEHLGDIMVKMSQMNGEMIVKMVVSSQMTKDVLEANINQLRHVFSPHQVIIEKQEPQMFQQEQQQSGQHRQFDQPNSDQQDNNSDAEQEKRKQSQENNESFHEMLMNEKV